MKIWSCGLQLNANKTEDVQCGLWNMFSML